MKILAEKETWLGGKYILVKFNEDFYAHGTEWDMRDPYGFPVNNCGTKEDVLKHCKSISKLCKKNILEYTKKMNKDHHKGWDILINKNEKELAALESFITILQ